MSVVYFYKVVEIFETSPQLEKTFWGIAKQVGWGAGGALLGGIVGGPVGAFVGTIAGAYVGFARTDDYQSLIKVLNNLSDAEKHRLQLKIQELVGSSSIDALVDYVQSEANRIMLLNVVREGAKHALNA